MMHTLVLRTPPALRVDARALQPAALCAMTREQVLRLALPHGRDRVALGEWFQVMAQADSAASPALRLEGDLSRFDCVAAGLAAGSVVVQGAVGDGVGLGMSAGVVTVQGHARDLAGCAMRGGTLEIQGDVGDLAASAMPGEPFGMSGGTLLVRGNAGARLADCMRRGTVAVHGNAGEFLASRLVAGTVAIGGRCGAHAGWAMRRGSVIFVGDAPRAPSTFVPAGSDMAVAWQLLARDLARWGGRFAELPRRPVARWIGDVAVAGQGEWLVAG